MNLTAYHESVNYKCLLGLEHQTTDLFLVYCGTEDCKPFHSYGNLPRSEHLIHFVFNGTGSFKLNRKSYKVCANQAFYIPPNTSDYHYDADASTPWSYAWIGFSGSKSSQYLEQTSLSIDNPVCDLNIDTQTIADLVHQILQAKALTQSNEIKRVGHLYCILAKLIESNYLSPADQHTFQYAPEVYAKYARKLIEHSYKYNNISDILQIVGIDRSYLYSLFTKMYQISPQQYLISCRLKDAQYQLLHTNLSIKQISSQVGYEDALNFSKLFKKYFSVSPTEYRRQHKS
ncbi:MAG: AraC family transcriptional regulator [Mobilitalea sp.]